MKTPSSEDETSGSTAVSQHLVRMDPSYQSVFTPKEIEAHTSLAKRLNKDHLVEVHSIQLDRETWQATIVAYDYPGELSLICGLLYGFDLNIESGYVYTYESLDRPVDEKYQLDAKRIIVDVFRVHHLHGEIPVGMWQKYADDLNQLLTLMDAGEGREARGELAKRIVRKLGDDTGQSTTLYPIEVEIDNSTSEKYTVLRIRAQDTVGFLYELTNALAFHRVYISQVIVESQGNRIFDTLFITDAEGKKIVDLEKQRELRAAIVLIKHFTHLLPLSANPEAALLHFRAFVEKLFQQPGWPEEVTSLERSEVLRALAQVLGVSDFLWEDFLRMQYENLFPVVRDIDELQSEKTGDELFQELDAYLQAPLDQYYDPIYGAGWRAAINAFKDREFFRIDMRNILGYTTAYEQFSQELTNLAEVVIHTAYKQCEQELLKEYGLTTLDGGGDCILSICALGKCGGCELGFASDIELMFIYSGKGQTVGPKIITIPEFYEKLVQLFLGAIRARREGIFQIDLQLRPYGKAGSMAVSLDAFQNYFSPHGPAWAYERQALVKLRPIAGNLEFGRQIEDLRDEFVYTGEPFDITAMRAMRERQVRHHVNGGTFNAKFSPGGLLDAEYLVQGMQINYGYRIPALRLTNTKEAMAALAEYGLITPEDYTRLKKAHTFLRWLIDSLRVVRGNAKDLTVPPFNSEEFEFLTRRLRYGKDIQRLHDELLRFTGDILELNQKLLGG